MKIPFRSSVNFGPSFPAGCFFFSANKAVFFNRAKTGKGHQAASPVCEGKAAGGKKTTAKKTTPKKKPAKKLVLAGTGKANCAGKGAAIKNEKACRAAATAVKVKFGSSGNFGASYPAGCFVSVVNQAVFFNKAKTGKGNKAASPVCVSGATGGKKTTPKKSTVKINLKRYKRATQPNDAYGRPINYLSRHRVTAGKTGVLTSVRFVRRMGTKNMYYDYTYVGMPASAVGKISYRYTNFGPNGNLEQLTRHVLKARGPIKNTDKCEFLNGFYLLPSSNNNVRYRYFVITAPCSGKCRNYATNCMSVQNKRLEYLQYHNIKVPQGYGMVSLRLVRQQGCAAGKGKFVYNACEFPKPSK